VSRSTSSAPSIPLMNAILFVKGASFECSGDIKRMQYGCADHWNLL
jgi:hypothetical protein